MKKKCRDTQDEQSYDLLWQQIFSSVEHALRAFGDTNMRSYETWLEVAMAPSCPYCICFRMESGNRIRPRHFIEQRWRGGLSSLHGRNHSNYTAKGTLSGLLRTVLH
jgi:hypothetical protein